MEGLLSTGPTPSSYIAAGRKLTAGNKTLFTFRKVTKEQVEKQIQMVEDTKSFGHNGISYGFLKNMSKWIVEELTEIMNLSLDTKCYPDSLKVARVKPLL